jgi:hypothetical protein
MWPYEATKKIIDLDKFCGTYDSKQIVQREHANRNRLLDTHAY